MSEELLIRFLESVKKYRNTSKELETMADKTMAYKIVKSHQSEARVNAMTAMHTYLLKEPVNLSPEDYAQHMKEQLEVICIGLGEIAIPFLGGKDSEGAADFLDQYETIIAYCREYMDSLIRTLKGRGHEDLDYNNIISFEDHWNHFQSTRWIDKSVLMVFYSGFWQKKVKKVLLLVKDVSFSDEHLVREWVSGGIYPTKDRGGYPPTSLNYPRPTFGAEEYPESPGVQDWGPPRPARKKKEE